jgi:hypothetical protein
MLLPGLTFSSHVRSLLSLSLTASVLRVQRFLPQPEIFRCPHLSSVPARIFVLNLFLSERCRQERAFRRSPRLGFQSSVCVSKGAAQFLRPWSAAPGARLPLTGPFSFLPSIQFFSAAEGLFAGPPLPILFAPASFSSLCPGPCLKSRSTCRSLIFESPGAGVQSPPFSVAVFCTGACSQRLITPLCNLVFSAGLVPCCTTRFFCRPVSCS